LRAPENHATRLNWPGDADVAVALTFDVDAESGWLSQGAEYADRLTTLSQAAFGPARGLSRILELLDAEEIPATFYVPGHTADHYPGPISLIIDRGHEIAHHGYLHRRTDRLDAAGERTELEQGLTALEKLGLRPLGYRSPSWEVTPVTLRLLADMGFTYDSSLMGDDRPYWDYSTGRPLLELPVHWSLDDWCYFGWNQYEGGSLADPLMVERVWLEEYNAARAECRLVTYTMHPEVIGRGYCMRMLGRIVSRMRERGRPWFTTHAQVAALAEAARSGTAP
jgi:peptidoglycan-N-acetylglucosamine deacetylase